MSIGVIDMSELMTDPELVETFTLRRPTDGAFDAHGVWRSIYTDTQIVGIAEPMSTQDAQMLPEGTRVDNMMSFWSATEMRIAAGKGTEADVIVYQGKSYKVVKQNPWGSRGYFKVMAEGFIP